MVSFVLKVTFEESFFSFQLNALNGVPTLKILTV